MSRLTARNEELQDGETVQKVKVNVYGASNLEIMRKFTVDSSTEYAIAFYILQIIQP